MFDDEESYVYIYIYNIHTYIYIYKYVYYICIYTHIYIYTHIHDCPHVFMISLSLVNHQQAKGVLDQRAKALGIS